jgi:hypothetical protein
MNHAMNLSFSHEDEDNAKLLEEEAFYGKYLFEA